MVNFLKAEMKNPKFKDTILWAISVMLSSAMLAGLFQQINLGWLTFSSWVVFLVCLLYICFEGIDEGLYQ